MENNNRTKIIIIAMISVVIILLIAITVVSSYSQKKSSNNTANKITNALTQNNVGTINKAQVNRISPTITPTATNSSLLATAAAQPTQSLKIPNQNVLNYTEIAKTTLDYLNLMRDQRGAYLFERSCDASNQCVDSEGNNHSGPRPIWVRYKYYQKTKDPQSITIIKNDLLVNTTKIETVQNDYWNCKLMQYISLDKKAFDQKTIEMMSQYCLTSVNPKFTFDANSQIKPVSGKIDIVDSAIFVSDLVGRYGFSRNTTDLNTAKYLYQLAYAQFQNQIKTINYEQVCTLGEAALDLYSKTGDVTYKNTALNLWTNQKVSAIGQKQEFSVLSAKAVCGLFTNRLALLTNSEQYRTVKKEIIALLLANNYDSKDGSFFEKINDKIYKRSKENSLIAGLLLEFDSFK